MIEELKAGILTEKQKQQMKEEKKRKMKLINEKYSKIKPKGPKSCIS